MPHWKDFDDPTAPTGRYLPWKEVARRTSLSRTTAWRLQQRGEFPRSHPISPGRVGHLEREVEAWMASRAGETRSAEPALRERPDEVELETKGPRESRPAAASSRGSASTMSGKQPLEPRVTGGHGHQLRFDF